MGDANLVAYWRFDDPEDLGIIKKYDEAEDASGNGHPLTLVALPQFGQDAVRNARLPGAGALPRAPTLEFSNNYAINSHLHSFPKEDITIAFWAQVRPRPSRRPLRGRPPRFPLGIRLGEDFLPERDG